MKTKVLHLKRAWRVGGPERIIFSILRHINKEAFDCQCVFHGPSIGEGVREWVDGERVHFLKGGRASFALFLKLLGRMKEAEILHSHDYKSSLLCYFLKIFHPSKKVVISVHGRLKHPLKTRFWELAEELFMNLSDAVIVGSYSMKDRLPQWIRREKVKIIQNFIEPLNCPKVETTKVREKLGIKENFMALTVSQFNEEKGHLYLIRAIPNVIKKYKDMVFVLVGEGPSKEKVRKEAERLGVLRYVIFTGFWQNLHSLYKVTDIFILPSLSESLPLVLLEAIWFGIPVVATDVGDVRRVIEQTGFGTLVPASDPKALAAGILSLRERLWKMKKRRECAKATLEKYYTIQSCIKEFEKVYNLLLCKK